MLMIKAADAHNCDLLLFSCPFYDTIMKKRGGGKHGKKDQ